MPSNRRVRLTPEADSDLTDILEYTFVRWDEAQMNEYAETLYEALGHLAVFPDLGRSRSDLEPALRSYPAGDHIIFYRATDDELIVRRIVHSRRAVSREELS